MIRPAVPEDAPTILAFIRELAGYERLSHAVTAALEDVRATLFGPDPQARVLIAEADGAPAGFALSFFTYSTFLARRGIWLEDLYVRPEFRGRGLGKALLTHLADECREQGYGRLEWSVLKWNAPLIAFYESLGAERMEEWVTYRLSGEGLNLSDAEAR